ncbi:Uu.00g003980.m01.CDS01 [Anthostomella pinea]|uniref:Uu.00g003980.m01.CDS01 n=1 Tax=Anthostomella pinea TaxID=933095 RepID=A0AAI8VJZ0_9PEZI|nr:Uu.00g003980.m01.CDS01 [Anthostomella pinea]
METVNNMATAAARAVWGENKQTDEPVSGRTGDTTKGEPYDAGNLEEPDSTTRVPGASSSTTSGPGATTSTTSGLNAPSHTTGGRDAPSSKTSRLDAPSSTTSGIHEPSSTTSGLGAPSSTTGGLNAPSSTTSGLHESNSTTSGSGAPITSIGGTAGETKTEDTQPAEFAKTESRPEETKPAEFAKTTGTATESNETPDNPSTEMKTRDTPQDTSKGQADVRDPEDPLTHPKSAPNDVNDADEGINESQKLGPGPKDLAEVAREHGGDAGNGKAEPLHGDKKDAPGEDEDEDGPGAKSKGEGTGEQYVKSSGLQADGGDFDVTKPGAGREADRLMEEKGMHKDAPEGASDDTGASKDHGEKKGLGQKIKEKLHRH